MGNKYVIGLDYGTESVRTVLVGVQTGEVAATAVHQYADNVIDRALPSSEKPLPPDWALQNPANWLEGLQETVCQVMQNSGVPPEAVVGLGIDFTACTILPTTATGQFLSQIPEFRNNPHAWAKLWKHHAAQKQADRINQLGIQRKEEWLSLYGGKISSEWVIPKALQIFEEAPEVYGAMDRLVEGADWVVWQLTGQLARNACGAGYKASWHKTKGYPPREFLEALKPGFGDFFAQKFGGPVVAPGQPVGRLLPEWAERLGLQAGIPVGAGIIDAHAATIGAGITRPGTMFMIMGTSTCHMVMGKAEVRVPGISGVVEDGIVPGLFGYEAGQVGVGDIFAWFVETCAPPAYHAEAQKRQISLHDLLSEKAGRLAPGESGLLALDWWNGCRTPLVNAKLSGMLVGATLATTPEEIYRALIEATAFGTRLIIEAFVEDGVTVERILAGGGLTKNDFLMQVYADITEREISEAGSPEVSAMGAAMLAATAAGLQGGGYANLTEAAEHIAPGVTKTYTPRREHAPIYRRLYAEYRRLVDYFGRGENPVMETLREIKLDASPSAPSR